MSLTKFFSHFSSRFGITAKSQILSASRFILQPRRCLRLKNYTAPTIDVNLATTTLSDDDERRFQMIKPAENFECISVNYDSLMQHLISILVKCGNRTVAREVVERTFENIKIAQLELLYSLSSPSASPQSVPAESTAVQASATTAPNSAAPAVPTTSSSAKSVDADDEADAADAEAAEDSSASETPQAQSVVINPHEILARAIENLTPALMIHRVVRAGFIYRVPVPCKPTYGEFMALRWLVQTAVDKEGTMRLHDSLATEILQAYRREGKAYRKKIDLMRLCEENRAYANLRMF